MTALPQPRAWPWWAGVSYGLLGLPLAFAALPLYVVLPHRYADGFGLPLATVGAILMLVRLLDAFVEPLIGRLSDRLFSRSIHAVLWLLGVAALAQAAGIAALFFPQVESPTALAGWIAAGMLFTCLAHSLLVITHQGWGIQLGGDDVQRSRIVAWREGFGLIGVISASALSTIWGPAAMVGVLSVALFLGWVALCRAPQPCTERPHHSPRYSLWEPLRVASFRRLLAVFLCNGIASAVPAVLMLFFVQDRLRATEVHTAIFLVLYFLCAALSMPFWLQLVKRIGLEKAWLTGMLLAIACFAWTANLATGQVWGFAIVCALTGVALGADLAIPGALLARLLGHLGAQGRNDGAYLGWWNLGTKLNLAVAAGASLPLLQWVGYTPGSHDPTALQSLAWAYALIPCILKSAAAFLLYQLLIRRPHSPLVLGD
jgi:GPH family glycoside/pentoside/hexuronide:cation symporter